MDEDFIPLGQVYAAMEQHIREAIPGLQYVGTMPSGIEVVPPPAVVLELAGFESAEEDPGTGQTAVDARFEARVLVPGRKTTACTLLHLWLLSWLSCSACSRGVWRCGSLSL